MEPWPHPTDTPVILSLICGYIISLLELISTIQKYVLLHFFFSKLHDYHSLDGCSYCNIYLSLFTHEPSLLTGCFIFCPLEHLFGLWDWSRAYFEWYMERQEWKNWTGGSTPHPNFQHHNFLSKYQSFNYYILMERPQWGDEQSKVVWGHFHHEVQSFGQSDISFFFIFFPHQTYRYSKFFFFFLSPMEVYMCLSHCRTLFMCFLMVWNWDGHIYFFLVSSLTRWFSQAIPKLSHESSFFNRKHYIYRNSI